jgi:transporter family-2 protein
LIIIKLRNTIYEIGCNATLKKYGGRSFSAVISFSVGLICCLIFFGVDVGALSTPLPTETLKSKIFNSNL